jgi:hypothetical protein
VEAHHQDGDQEDQLGGEHRLDHAELAGAERRRLQHEHAEHEAEPDQPATLLQRVGHQPGTQAGDGGSRLQGDPLEHHRQGRQ